MPSVALVAGLALAFAVGTGQHFTTFGLYVVGAVFVSVLITVFRGSYEMRDRHRCCAPPACAARSCSSATTRRARISVHRSARAGAASIYDFVGEVEHGADVEAALDEFSLDELIVADTGLDERGCSRSSTTPTAAVSRCASRRGPPSS